MKIDHGKLCCIIRKTRKQNDLSQIQISHKLCITQKTYSKLEADQGNMSLIQFLRILHVLHLHPMEVINQIVAENPSWCDKKSVEGVLKNEIAELRIRNDELKSENVILRKQIDNLLKKPCCRE